MLQLGGSLIAILALAGLAAWLRLGKARDFSDPEAVSALADAELYGWQSAEVACDAAGKAALVMEQDGRIALLAAHGSHLVARELGRPARAVQDGTRLTIRTGERMLPPVTLDLGGAAQAWFTRIRALS